jgi:hypothetical protein
LHGAGLVRTKENNRMKPKGAWLIGGWTVLGLLATRLPARAEGIQDFKLARAIPADTMLLVETRDHPGREFLDQQFKRVWAAVEKQGFDRDLRRLLRGMIQQKEGNVEEFDQQWQQISDLCAAVNWSTLAQREFAFAMKLGLPMGADFVLLMMPPEDQLAKDFEGLSALLKSLAGLAPEGMLQLSTEGEGEVVLHRLSVGQQTPPVGLTLARHKDVVLIGFGSSMVEQSLALLRGESDPNTAALPSTDRFKQAFKRLPPPADEFYFIDLSKIFTQCRGFAKMLAGLWQPVTTQAATQPGQPAGSQLAFLEPLIDAIDIWDYLAGVESTQGLKTTGDEIAVLREEAKSRPLRQALYGGHPVRQPLKYIPQEATGVHVCGGMDFGALYHAVIDFVAKEVPQGDDLIARWKQVQEDAGFDVQEDLLSWLGGGFASFTATRTSVYAPEWVYIVEVRDEQKARETLEDLCQRLNELLQPRNGSVEDAKLPGAEGFKQVVVPMRYAMIPGLGQPVLGIHDGHLLIGNSPKIIALALEVAAGEKENFAKNERFINEGLPLAENVTAFSFKDLSRFGQELGQKFAIAGLAQMFMPPQVTKDPAVLTILSVVNKIGNVVRTLDFYRSSCTVSTFDGKVGTTKTVTNYQEPPKPKPTTQEQPGAEEGAEAAPAGKQPE